LQHFLEADAQYYADQAAHDYDPTNPHLHHHEADDWEAGHVHPDGEFYEDYDLGLDIGFLETLLIVALAAVLGVLVYWRNRVRREGRAEEERRDADANGNAQGQGQVQGQDGGLFPRPGEPEFGAWVAGGVGH